MARTARRPPPTVERRDAGAIVAIAFAMLLPLAVNPWGFQQRMPIAWWLVLLLVPVGFGLSVRAVGGVLETHTMRWWLGLLGVLAVATATSVAPFNALIGSPARHLGLVGWTVLAVACWWGVHVGQRVGTAERLARALVLGSLPVSIIGLVERGERFFSFGDGLNLVRSASTLKNAAFLGAYLALVVPIAVRLALDATGDVRWRALAAVATAAGLATLVFSQTRAAWLGTLAAVALLGVVELRARGRQGRALPAIVAGVTVVIVAIVAVAPLRDRALSVTVLGQGSTRARTLLWERAVPTIAHRPLLGYGPDATVLAYPRYLNDTFERDVTRQTLPDRAHNLVLDLGIWGGLPAIVLGAALVVSVFRRADPSRLGPAGWGIAAGLLAYLVQLGFSFPLADLDALVWLLVGVLVAPDARRIALPAGFTRGVVGVSVAAAVAGALWQGRDVLADRQLRVAIDADARGDVAGAEAAFRRATNLAGERAQYWQAYGRFERFVGEAARDRTRLARSAAAHTRALELLPGDTSYALDRLDAELSIAELGPGDTTAVVAGLQDVVRRDPSSARGLFALGVAQADAGQLDAARASWERAHGLVASWSSGPARNLARLADKGGDVTTARRWYREVLAIEGSDDEAGAYLSAHPG